MPRQLRLFRRAPLTPPPIAVAWAICQADGATPYAVVKLIENRADVRDGVRYCVTLDAARASVPDGCLCLAAPFTTAPGGLPRALANVLELWF